MVVLQIAAKPRCRWRSQPRGHRRSAPCEKKSWGTGWEKGGHLGHWPDRTLMHSRLGKQTEPGTASL